jgi:hypothetical protein
MEVLGGVVLEFGFVPQSVITDLQDIGNWKVGVVRSPKKLLS